MLSTRILSALAFTATAIVTAFGLGLLTELKMTALHTRRVAVPERPRLLGRAQAWTEVFAMVRGVEWC